MSDKKLANKVNKRSVYMSQSRRNKTLQIWIPPSLDVDDYANQFSLLVSQFALIAEPIDVGDYQNDFENFYNIHIASKYDDKTVNDYDTDDVKQLKLKKHLFFCSTDKAGGVDSGYIIQTANRKDTATIVSMDVDESTGEILEIYALASFNVSNKKMAIHVSTLCGNQLLPPSGEGTRLLKLIENLGNDAGLTKVFLDPVDSAIPFYGSKRYRVMGDKDSGASSRSSRSRSSRSSRSSKSSNSSSSGEPIQMQKNMKAQKHWDKIRASYNLGVLLSRSRKSIATHKLKDKYQSIRDDEIASRPSLTGKPINPPGSSLHSFRKGFVPDSSKMAHGIPSAIIVPGDSLKKHRKTTKLNKAMRRHKTFKKSMRRH